MSEVKVNKISPRTACGTVTLGDSGDSFVIPSGATITNNGTQVGFGRTGTVDWVTTVQTSTITAATGSGYFVNTTGGAITANLPAGAAGSIVAFKDYANTFDSNNLTIAANGSEKINGDTIDLIVSTEGEALTLVYIDATKGWLVVNDGNNDAGLQPSYITATGGTILTVGDYKTHVFTGPGTFCVSCAGNPGGSDTLEYLVVAGGGGSQDGGGGAGGFRMYTSAPGSNSPLNAPAGLTAAATPYSVTVGAGGTGVNPGAAVASGAVSTFSTITSAGGGYGKSACGAASPGGSGGSGKPLGNGNDPPTAPPQGQPGGCAPAPGASSGGGGGAGGTGGAANPGPRIGGTGGYLADSFFGPTAPSYGTAGPTGSTRYFSGGGSGGASSPQSFSTAPAPLGGGGGQGLANAPGGGASPVPGPQCATVNTGGGGGGAWFGTNGSGASGVVAIRYKFQ